MDFWIGVLELLLGLALLVWVVRGGVARMLAPALALVRDAHRYRRLRQMHWSEGGLCVTDARSVKLGADCPSEDRLDAVIDGLRRDCRVNLKEHTR